MSSWLVPNYVYCSRLYGLGGFEVYSGLLSTHWHQLLLNEAHDLLPSAKETKVLQPDSEEWRGGNPSRVFLSAPSGSAQFAFYHSPHLRSFLERVTGHLIQLGGTQGSYSFYMREGDHLALHRDVEFCDIAVITCLQDTAPTAPKGGILYVYPDRCCEPLSQLRATLSQGALPICLEPNHTIVMYGGMIPHLVTPVTKNQVRIISILCFHI